MLWFTLSLELNTLLAGSAVSCNYRRRYSPGRGHGSPRRERRWQGDQRRAQSPSDALRAGSATPGDGQRAPHDHARAGAVRCVASCRARAPARRIASPFQCHCHTPREALAGTRRRHVSGGVRALVSDAAASAPAGRGRHAARCRCRACMRPLPKVMVAPATPRRTGARQY